jgi:hypothetical protein
MMKWQSQYCPNGRGLMLDEIIFLVQKAFEGGYTAQALGHSIFTGADTWEELKEAVQDAVRCHFERDVLVRSLPDK